MAQFGVGSERELKMLREMSELGISENEITESFEHPSKRTKQQSNKPSSCVYLRHEPSGIEIKCQQANSQSDNRLLARRELCDKINSMLRGRPPKGRKPLANKKKKRRPRKQRPQQKTTDNNNSN